MVFDWRRLVVLPGFCNTPPRPRQEDLGAQGIYKGGFSIYLFASRFPSILLFFVTCRFTAIQLMKYRSIQGGGGDVYHIYMMSTKALIIS
jgi:hypothetical protein